MFKPVEIRVVRWEHSGYSNDYSGYQGHYFSGNNVIECLESVKKAFPNEKLKFCVFKENGEFIGATNDLPHFEVDKYLESHKS